jgi:serine/threonine-protein kinase
MSEPLVLGRYRLHDEIASGGMATVHLARQTGDGGFVRTVAIKRLHGHLARDPEFVAMFLDEARLAARIRHPNVVPTLDVVSFDKELFLVMEYASGQSLARLLAARPSHDAVPVEIIVAILIGALNGLHAAHGATNEKGELLHLVHRDVSPQNILVGDDGVARIVDFGIAKAIGRSHTTRDGRVRGKTAYMAPEQLAGRKVDARTDVYAASVVLWEALAGTRLFTGETPEETVIKVLEREIPPPSNLNPDIPAALDACILRGLSRNPEHRFASAREMALALEAIVTPATAHTVGQWVQTLAGATLRERAAAIAAMESLQPHVIAVERALDDTRDTDEIRQATTLRPPRRSRALVFGALGVVALGVVLAARLTWSSRSVASAAPPPASALPAPSPAASSAMVAEPEPPSPSAAASRPEASALGSEKTRRPSRKSPVTPPTKKKCDPPYTLDKNGDRVPKPECL